YDSGVVAARIEKRDFGLIFPARRLDLFARLGLYRLLDRLSRLSRLLRLRRRGLLISHDERVAFEGRGAALGNDTTFEDRLVLLVEDLHLIGLDIHVLRFFCLLCGLRRVDGLYGR